MTADPLMSRAAAARPAFATEAAASQSPDRLGVWCGWVLIGAAVLTPLLAWLSPLGFAPLLAAAGLLCLPALRIEPGDRPLLLLLLAGVVWAAISTAWSPYHPKHFSTDTPVQIALALPLAWSAICGARRADRRLQRRALQTLAWGLAMLGLTLAVEAGNGARIYQWLHVTFYEPIRPDLAERNEGQTTFVTALLWPVGMGAVRRWRDVWLPLPALVGTVAAAHAFGADAPVLAAPLALAVALAVWRWPSAGPALLAAGAAALFELMPLLIWGARASGRYEQLQHAAPPSWAWRMGYWSRVVDWITQHPFRGWGLDASRVIGEGVALHPHDNELQLWLELGVLGALFAAAFWTLTFLKMRRPQPSWAMAGVAASASVYVLYASANFGVWQGWFIGLGGFVAVLAAALPADADAANEAAG